MGALGKEQEMCDLEAPLQPAWLWERAHTWQGLAASETTSPAEQQQPLRPTVGHCTVLGVLFYSVYQKKKEKSIL